MGDEVQGSVRLHGEGEMRDLVFDVPDGALSKLTSDREIVRSLALARVMPGIADVPVDNIIVWTGAAQQPDGVDPAELELEVEIFQASGQRAQVIGRRTVTGAVEIITNTYILEVVRLHNERHPEAPTNLTVDIREIGDRDAYRLVARQIETGPTICSYDRGLFYQRAVGVFGSEVAVANECGIHKGTVSKNLDVIRAIGVAGGKILVHRDVAQRDATWLMGVLGRTGDPSAAPDADAAERVTGALRASNIVPAKTLFAALKAALKADKPRKGHSPLVHDGQPIGWIRSRKNGGPIRIELTDAGDIELDMVLQVIRRALAAARTPRTI